ncbi:outer membrane lipoprotein LolB [Ideonella dechloratans]|uniref:Outer-membrane lipoprotein LolB n=1 Tax=Ideonella dechloratans TaxID=36863 RepID=A0A643FGI5_IDEDE|nr:lipoprotein insertase outer membrane protein LolB [Ideonella dechloratans]KAB0584446.1 outer membrane lipoprotein LolB [Ideonella dechloratans]UFU10885.1 outer membrane lipoprotein LolB [Ideonella dechloratans]
MATAPAWLRRTLLGAGLCWLAGCATAPSGPVDYSGRLAVTVAAEGDRPAESHSAAFELGGDAHQGHLRLLSPLGTVVADATWEADHVRLETGDGPRDYPSLEALAEDALGQAIPLGALLAWLQGRPWNGAPHEAEAQGFHQLGWSVDIHALKTEGALVARRDSPPAVTLRARLDR